MYVSLAANAFVLSFVFEKLAPDTLTLFTVSCRPATPGSLLSCVLKKCVPAGRLKTCEYVPDVTLYVAFASPITTSICGPDVPLACTSTVTDAGDARVMYVPT